MDDYQQKYNNLQKELQTIEQKLAAALLLSKAKEKERKNLAKKYDDLVKDIEKLEQIKNSILYKINNKINIIIKIIGTTITIPIIIAIVNYFINKFLGTPQTILKVLYLLSLVFDCSILLIGTTFTIRSIIKIIVKKYESKIIISDNYQRLLKEIEVKVQERINIRKRQKILTKESLDATLNYSAQNACMNIKKEELKRFKNDFFNIATNNSEEIEEKYKTLKRIKKN